jgi:ABC-type nitrate/sulfonate/bicarbonate transport system substrate-binding protein
MLAMVLAAGVAAVPAAAQQKLEDVTMAVPTFSLSFSLGYLAEDIGFFTKHGLRVKSVEIVGLGAINSVISGSSDFAEPSSGSLTRAAAKGQRLVAIAELLNRPIVQVVLRKDIAEEANFDPKAPLAQRALALKGRTIGVDSINSVIHAYVRLMAKRAGYDPESIRVAPMQPASLLAALQTKAIDGFAMSPPWPLKPVLDGTAVMIASGPDGDPADMVPFSNTVLVTRPETCEKRKSVCEGMGHAFADAAAFMHEHPDEALTALKKRFPTVDDALLKASFDVIRKITPNPPAVSRAGLENTELYNIDAGLLKPEEKLKSYEGLYTDAYVK